MLTVGIVQSIHPRTNLITNGEFETNTTGWISDGGTITRETVSPLVGTGSLKFVTSMGVPYVYQFIGGIVGHTYYARGLMKSTAAGGRKCRMIVTLGASASGISLDCSASAQTVSVTFTATATNLLLLPQLDAYVAGESFLLDSVVCYDLSV